MAGWRARIPWWGRRRGKWIFRYSLSKFLAQARRYEQSFRQFLDERDRADPESHHLFGLAAGLSSRPVPPEAVPRFHEDLSMAIALTDAALDLALLGLFALLSFLAAHLVFLRRELS